VSVAPLEIGAVARELGVATSTLRSWERRYRIVVPSRGENGQRLYDSEQIVILRQILAQTRLGVRARTAHRAASNEQPRDTARLRLDPSPDAPVAVRREIERLLDDGAHGEQFRFNARLVASELVKNAVVHGAPDEHIDVVIAVHPNWIDLHVRNSGGRLALRTLRARSREHGHGLDIVDALADSWTIDTGPHGTTVKVRLAASAEDV
jgi:DNA-binding transcriptional MerR regulator